MASMGRMARKLCSPKGVLIAVTRVPFALARVPDRARGSVPDAPRGVPSALTRVPGSFEKIMINCG